MYNLKLKPLALTTCLLACIQILIAQEISNWTSTYEINFENDWNFIEFDPPENNIWQVGKPSKQFLDSAYSKQFAIMTHTTKMIDTAYEHSFILKLERPWFGNCLFEWGLQFEHKYSFDSLNSGGYINVSYDKGQNWHDINIDSVIYDNGVGSSIFYNENDTLWNGMPGFTGKKDFSEYPSVCSTVWMMDYLHAAKIYNVWLKFTYSSNANCKLHEGWLIDDIFFEIYHWCEFLDIFNHIAANYETKAYPNPACNNITIAFDNNNKVYTLSIFNIQGMLIKQIYNVSNNAINIDICNLPKGEYFYLLQNNNTYSHKGSFIKQ